MNRRRGFTMLDVFFLMMIVTVVLIPIAGMFPLGHVAVQRGKNISVAAFLAEQAINQLRLKFPTGLLNYVNNPLIATTTTTVEGVQYDITSKLWTVETRRWIQNGVTTTECYVADATVTVTFPQGMPFVYSTRLFADAHAMQEQ